MAAVDEQLEAMRSLPENWDGYGAAALFPHAIDLAREFAGFVDALCRRSSTAQGTLQVSPTRVGGVLLEWEDDATQHEVEILPDLSLSFLHLNKATGQIRTRKLSPNQAAVVQPGFLQELSRLLAA